MWIRYKFINTISDSEQVKKALGRNGTRSYLFWKKDGAMCDVRNKEDICFLLNPEGGRISDYEIAYEKYGIFFDTAGNEVSPSQPAASTAKTEAISLSSNGTISTETALLPSVNPKPKMSVMERMAKARAARKSKLVRELTQGA